MVTVGLYTVWFWTAKLSAKKYAYTKKWKVMVTVGLYTVWFWTAKPPPKISPLGPLQGSKKSLFLLGVAREVPHG
jgi:hypothetical protein